jgi:hypothetical protein
LRRTRSTYGRRLPSRRPAAYTDDELRDRRERRRRADRARAWIVLVTVPLFGILLGVGHAATAFSLLLAAFIAYLVVGRSGR